MSKALLRLVRDGPEVASEALHKGIDPMLNIVTFESGHFLCRDQRAACD
jgi:hypothetical protein